MKSSMHSHINGFLKKVQVVLWVFMLPMFCPNSAYAEDPSIEELNAKIAEQTKAQNALKKQKDDIQADIDSIDEKIIKLKSEQHKLSVDVKKTQLAIKRANMFSSSADKEKAKNEIIGLNFDLKRIESDTAKKEAELAKLEKDKSDAQLRLSTVDASLKLQSNQQVLVTQKKIVQKKTEEKNTNEFVQDFNARRMEAMAQARKMEALKVVQAQAADEGSAQNPDEVLPEVVQQPQEVAPPNIRQQQEALIEESKTMRPAAAALNLAKARALKPMSAPPILGERPGLGYSKPVGSDVKNLGQMQHLGNNQYMLEIPIKDGKQEFVVDKFRFFKMIPSQYNGVRCMILLDLQDSNAPNFQVIVID